MGKNPWLWFGEDEDVADDHYEEMRAVLHDNRLEQNQNTRCLLADW